MADTGTGGRWNIPGVPHKGWTCAGVVDLGEESPDYIPGVCGMCGNPGLRYLHTMSHPEHDPIDVGAVCASNMESDPAAPETRERRMKGKAGVRSRWLTRHWPYHLDEPHYRPRCHLKSRGHMMEVRQLPDKTYKARFDGREGKLVHPTLDAAKLALFVVYWNALEKDGLV